MADKMVPGGGSGAVTPGYAELYAGLPDISCLRLCHPACGPIVVPAEEWDRGGTPRGESLPCPHLDEGAGLCRAHELRPLICRLWGVVESMRCPWGCEPERWLSAAEAAELLDRALRLSDGRVTSAWLGWDRFLETR